MTAIAPILPETIQLAVSTLRRGGLVAIPTETVYGLACDATNPDAVARLYEAKGRPRFNPLIAHVASLPMAQKEAQFSAAASHTAAMLWPGPLTLVLPVAEGGTVCDLARAGLDTIALRMPAHKGARDLIEAFGKPLVAPSANRSGHVSPTRAEHVKADLDGKVDLILDGGPCEKGIESTIVSFVGERPQLLRAGALETSVLDNFLFGGIARGGEGEGITAPGQLKSHYAPDATLRLNAETPEPGEGWLGFGPGPHMGLNLSPSGDLHEAAARLFAALRALDGRYDRIAVAPIPNEGLGEAINDRLARAAHRD
ncbi:MAG: L-threonylcarbamoyladenylate synthase [Hyphomonas sp.]|uniref:L-threonylcarbamoyladenylate synthase n=1 Tax=Hyphomonas sp. TaxID=87 RepID=UPI003528362A